jgi:hypothetical protein
MLTNGRPKKIDFLKKLHQGTDWMFDSRKEEILRECLFELPIKGQVTTAEDVIKFSFDRYVFPALKAGERLITTVVGKVLDKFVVVNFEKYLVVMGGRATDTLLGAFFRRNVKLLGFLGFDEKRNLAIGMGFDVGSGRMVVRAVKVEWKEELGKRVAERFLDQSVPLEGVKDFFRKFGLLMEIDPEKGEIKPI